MHFGQGSAASERAKESDLIDCLTAHAGHVDHLYLVGDVFEGYIEYRHLVPKGFVRFQGLLADWTDAGTPVTYLVGNHDPWHRDYFAEELGVRIVSGPLETVHEGLRLYLTHGDALGSTHSLYPWLRPLLRNSALVALYQTLLPADLGLRLAQWVSQRLHEEDPDPEVVDALRTQAEHLLQQDGLDAVVMGHSHVPALHSSPQGVYVNTGNWYENRSFARLEDDGLHLLRWNGTRAIDIESVGL